MRELTDGETLYHGSYCEVRRPQLQYCARYKDFGQGFYLTTSCKQAENFARISARKAAVNGMIGVDSRCGFVSVFKFTSIEGLSIRVYPTADTAWLHCVVGHRRAKTFSGLIRELSEMDIIGGKIANDNTNATITAYMAGAYGELGTAQADAICISLLLPERLQDQFCFKTQEALGRLIFVESRQIWL